MRILKLFISSVIFVSLQSCFCWEIARTNNTRTLPKVKEIDTVCCLTLVGGGIGIQVIPYRSSFEMEKFRYQNIHNDLTRRKSIGRLGIKAEKYMSPFGIVPFRIMGVGIDYSYLPYNLGQENNSTELRINNHRVMGSISLITFAHPWGFMGYANFQAGNIYESESIIKSSLDPVISKSKEFDFRFGYGLQYYLSRDFAITGEFGYGKKTYFKYGLSKWF